MKSLFLFLNQKRTTVKPPTFSHKQRLFSLFCGLLFLYFIPLIFNGKDSYIVIHDNLDSEVVWRVVLSWNNAIVNNSGIEVIPQIMDGIPRSYMISELNFILLLFKIFSPFGAYLINHIIVHVIAFIGMYLFTSHYLLTDQDQDVNYQLISLGVALAFSVLPFYTMYGFSVAGQPLLLYSFLNIVYEKGKFTDYLFLLFFPFYSFLFLNGVFLIIELFLVFFYFLIVKKHYVRQALLICLIFSIEYLIVEHNLIQTFLFNSNIVSHRSDWNLNYLSYPIRGVINNAISMFLLGQYHASSYHEIILFISLLALIVSFRKGWKKNPILLLLLLQLFIAVFYGFFMWDKLIPIKSFLGSFSSFNWGRLHWLSPFIWYCLSFLSLMAVYKYQRLGRMKIRILIIVLLIFQVIVNLFHNPEYGGYLSRYVTIPTVSAEGITYRQFFSENLFQKIEDTIDLPKEDYRVASIGIHPSIAQYNGFYTLDGYQNNYPLAYKQQFRKIIAPELEKSKTWREYFDYWGSRCYLFSSEIPDFLSTKEKGRTITALDIDTQAFIDLGGRFIFSAVEILNYKEDNLNFIGVFDDKDSAWRIFVYEVVDR
jgi:Protein of unknown function (DUF6044)